MILAAALPENSNDGYVAAAYIVFFVLLLVYVAIVAWRLARVERSVRDLRARESGKDEEHVRRREETLSRSGEAEEIEAGSAGDRGRARDGEGQAV